MNDLNARKKEFYCAYDDAALRILLDRYADREGEALRLELRALPPEENAAPAGEEEAVMRILSRCAGKKRAAGLRRKKARRRESPPEESAMSGRLMVKTP